MTCVHWESRWRALLSSPRFIALKVSARALSGAVNRSPSSLQRQGDTNAPYATYVQYSKLRNCKEGTFKLPNTQLRQSLAMLRYVLRRLSSWERNVAT